MVDLDHLEAAAGLRPQQRHHALIVGRDRDRGAAVAVEVRHLGVAHAAELAAEVLAPDRGADGPCRGVLPELHDRRGAAQARAAGLPPRPGRRSALWKTLLSGSSSALISHCPPRKARNSSRAGSGHGLAVALGELREREHQPLVGIGGRGRAAGAAAPVGPRPAPPSRRRRSQQAVSAVTESQTCVPGASASWVLLLRRAGDVAGRAAPDSRGRDVVIDSA